MMPPVRCLSFGGAAELARCGVKILHPVCVKPAQRAGIPVRPLNMLNSLAPGAPISHVINRDMTKAVSAKDRMCIVTFLPRHLSDSDVSMRQFLITLAETTHRLHIKLDILMTSDDGCAIVTEEDLGATDTLIKEMIL